MKISRNILFFATTYLWALFLVFSWRHSNPVGLLNIIGFISLIIVPGLLTVLALGLGRVLPFWHRFAQMIGFSILELYIWILLCNTFLPYLGLHRPLDHKPLTFELAILYVGICCWSYPRLKNVRIRLSNKLIYKSRADVIAILFPLVFILLSVLGATSLNNGGTDIFTMIMLIGVSVYIGLMLLLRHKLSDNTFAWVIYMLALSLLFMTSLRGWYTTGHDIQHEYDVFLLTQRTGIWSMSHQTDPYNACLSITMLPTIFFNMLHVPSQYVYKVLFQCIFATVPVIIYQLVRRYLTKAKSLLAVVYFIGFPTFYTDMPFLNRQETAFLFLALMLLVICDDRIKLRKKQWMFILFGLGMVLSHYSTTYSVLLLLFFVMCAQPIYARLAPWLSHKKLFKKSSLQVVDGGLKKMTQAVSVPMVVMLFYFCFIWYTVITNTSSGATSIVGQSISSIKNGLNADSRSNDVSYSLLKASSASPEQQLTSYEKTDINPQRVGVPPGIFYPTADINKYPVHVVQDYSEPLTTIGNFFSRLGINVQNFNYVMKQSSAKLLQILVIIGLLYLVFRKRFTRPIEPEFFLFACGSLLFVLLQVVLPDLSQAYGLLRAFQQSLMALGLLLVVGTFYLGSLLRNKWIYYIFPTFVALFFFLSSTGVISQLLGGYQAQLFLNNSGQYYDVYYTHKEEIVAIDWLNNVTQENKYGRKTQAVLQADEFEATKIATYTNINTINDISPGIIQENSYVFLGYTNVTKQQAAIFYNGDLIDFTLPTQFLNQEKNLIYSNGKSEIYK